MMGYAVAVVRPLARPAAIDVIAQMISMHEVLNILGQRRRAKTNQDLRLRKRVRIESQIMLSYAPIVLPPLILDVNSAKIG